MNKRPKLDQRSLEVKASQGYLAKTKTVAATVFNILKTSPEQVKRVWKALRRLHKVVKSSALYNAEGIYADYLFNGENIDYKLLDKKVKKLQDEEKEKITGKKIKYSHAIALTDPILMQKLLDHGVNFDANLSAQKKLREFAHVLCPNGIQFIDEESKINLIEAVSLSEKLGKKLIVLPNHVSHMDALVIDAFFKGLRVDGVLPKNKKIRLVEGVYMAFTPGVRQFSIGFNTTKVIGFSDMDVLLSHAKKNNNEVIIEYEDGEEYYKTTTTPIKQIRKLKELVREKYFANKENEIGIIFPYAGRGEYGGVKNEINTFMKDFLVSEECIYISLNLHDTDQLKPTKSDFFIGAHTWFQPYDIKTHISKPWIGGTKDLQEIHETMLEQRNIMWPQFTDIEKKQAHEKVIIETQNKISDIISFVEDGGELNEFEIKDYDELVLQYLQVRDCEM